MRLCRQGGALVALYSFCCCLLGPSSGLVPPINNGQPNTSVSQLLKQYSLDQRLLTLEKGSNNKKIDSLQLPLVAEIYSNGQVQVVQITDWEITATSPGVVTFQLDTGATIDLGQVTTIWQNDDNHKDEKSLLLAENRTAIAHYHKQTTTTLPEASLDALYKSYVGRGRQQPVYTKKQLQSIIVQNLLTTTQQQLATTLVQKITKTGRTMGRLVDSKLSQRYLGPDRVACAHWLGRDKGRFKRWPCLLVECNDGGDDNNGSDNDDQSSSSVTIINGGWLVVDQSVRATKEAQMLVENFDSSSSPPMSNQRILLRLECLAMGENLQSFELETDVKATLQKLELPFTPAGAKQALIQLGRWSNDRMETLKRQKYTQPWPPHILTAARAFVQHIVAEETATDPSDSASSRIHLTHWPSVCIDAPRTSFRDDALGVRPRATTGRRCIEEASQWELLIHIADVSPLYYNTKEQFEPLVLAAQERGWSRYDLPLGPLHLLPPVVLESLAFSKTKSNNRAVTLWAYIDERSGKLLDAGIERTLIAPPVTLSFAEANAILQGNGNAATERLFPVLGVIERNLEKWKHYRTSRSKVAQKREARLSARQSDGGMFDDGRDGFRRTRGHRLVDTALDLYSFAATGLLRRSRVPIPRAAGAGSAQGARLATAPLRRYIDGQVQLQLLATQANYGKVLSAEECESIATQATASRNAITNVRSVRK